MKFMVVIRREGWQTANVDHFKLGHNRKVHTFDAIEADSEKDASAKALDGLSGAWRVAFVMEIPTEEEA